MYHFVWQDVYQTGDDLADSQHRDIFTLANQLVASVSTEELYKNIQLVYRYVKEHFNTEEELMEQSDFRHYKDHAKEHDAILEQLTKIEHKITNSEWKKTDIREFMDKWADHIVHSDMVLNKHLKKLELEAV